MKKMIFVLAGILTFAIAPALADTATEAEIKKLIIEDNAYSKKHLKGAEDTVSSEGSLEFWSSGGLLHALSADLEPDEFKTFALDVKHIHVITLVQGKPQLLSIILKDRWSARAAEPSAITEPGQPRYLSKRTANGK